MAYKTILTVITGEGQAGQIDAAVSLARRQDAHLEVFCLGVDHTQTGYYYAGASAYVFQEAIDRAMQSAEALESRIRARLNPEDIRWSVESAVAQMGGVSTLIGMRARFADLTVLTKPYGDQSLPDAEAVVEAALFEGGCPVLILPETGLPDTLGRNMLIAWNQSTEALTTIRRALPLMKAADTVEVTVVDPPTHGAEGSDPGGALCQMLTRHGVNASIAVLAKTQPLISDVLMQRAIEIGADMMVMGAYSHSRFREAILGGATRSILEKATLPVFMAR